MVFNITAWMTGEITILALVAYANEKVNHTL